jgi:hypothetical protein
MVFDDKVYQDMDWLEKVCEPMRCPLNDVMAKFPDKVEITYDMLQEVDVVGSGGLTTERILRSVLDKGDALGKLSYKDKEEILKCFNFEVEGDPILNLEDKTLTKGKIFMLKTKIAFEDKDIKRMVGRNAISTVNTINTRSVTAARANEILELLGLESSMSHRSVRKKLRDLSCEFRDIMQENRWNIRDINLSNRVGKWLKRYLEDGNLAAYANFCKLKVMTNYDAPIYSVEDEEKV